MHVVKRNGETQAVSFDKILYRLKALSTNLFKIDVAVVAQKTINGLHNGVKTVELDNLAAETAAYMITHHPEYGLLAARIEISNIEKSTPPTFSEYVTQSGLPDDISKFVHEYAEDLNNAINYERDGMFDFFAIRTLMKSYLRRSPSTGEIIERPQYCLMRISVGIHYKEGTIHDIIETYDALSSGKGSHATPTMFNSGTKFPQMASCFLMRIPEDSIDGIYDANKWCAKISKYAGGIGIDVSNVRCRGSRINGTDGTSNGLVPMLQVYDKTARYVDQGGGKRKGSIAVYLEVWHPDLLDVLEMKKNHGKEELKARDLFYALWVCDIFMKRVENDEDWSFFCPSVCQDLLELYGDEFEEKYKQYEKEEKFTKRIKARAVWAHILDTQIETGTPYILYKDSCNKKSNQKNRGVLRCSNLCTEILEFVSKDEISVCNLASVSLSSCVHNGTFSYEQLECTTRMFVRNLNKVIDYGFYPLEETKVSNLRNRPIGIGVQGLADVFMKLSIPFEGPEAAEINSNIFETMYYSALHESMLLAKEKGPYPAYYKTEWNLDDSPLAKGYIQPDLWDFKVNDERHNWSELRTLVKEHGARNSLLLAPMPTASTAQILGNIECFEPITSNMYNRRVLSGEFPVINKHLVADLESLGLWNDATRQTILRDRGSVQNVEGLPDHLKSVYKTVWEIKMRTIIDMAADRGVWIDQSQSLNLFLDNPTHAKLTSMHMYGWKKGLKTGQYYLRSQAGADAANVSVCPIGCTTCSA